MAKNISLQYFLPKRVESVYLCLNVYSWTLYKNEFKVIFAFFSLPVPKVRLGICDLRVKLDIFFDASKTSLKNWSVWISAYFFYCFNGCWVTTFFIYFSKKKIIKKYNNRQTYAMPISVESYGWFSLFEPM